MTVSVPHVHASILPWVTEIQFLQEEGDSIPIVALPGVRRVLKEQYEEY
jgi:hypothetical protein